MATATHRMTLDEFLALPETEPPSEFVCGEVIQKSMPTYAHGLIASAISALLFIYLGRTSKGTVTVETRHANRPEQRSYLPDVGVFLHGHAPRGEERFRRAVENPPDLAVEILSPDDRPGRVAEKLAFYLRTGVPLVWIVDPEARTLDAHRPGVPSETYQPPARVSGAPVLPGFELDIAELFAPLDE